MAGVEGLLFKPVSELVKAQCPDRALRANRALDVNHTFILGILSKVTLIFFILYVAGERCSRLSDIMELVMMLQFGMVV